MPKIELLIKKKLWA